MSEHLSVIDQTSYSIDNLTKVNLTGAHSRTQPTGLPCQLQEIITHNSFPNCIVICQHEILLLSFYYSLSCRK